MSRNRFEPLLLDICINQLGMNVYSKRTTRGLKVFNIAVRSSSPKYENYPSLVEVASNKDEYKEFYGAELLTNDNARMEDDLKQVNE
jgi:hypothetical protein